MCRAYDEYVVGLTENDTKLEFHQWRLQIFMIMPTL